MEKNNIKSRKSIQVQKSINSDIIMVWMNVLNSPQIKILSKSIDVSTNWAKRSKTEFGHDKSKPYLELYKGLYKDLKLKV